MNMKKLIESMDRIEECGMTEMPVMSAPMQQGNPVTMSVSLNASGKDHVDDLINMMKNAGMGAAEPVAAKMLSPRMDMERLSGIMNGPMDEPDMEEIDVDMDEEGTCPECGMESCECDHTEEAADGGFGDATTEPDPEYGDMSDAIPNGDDLHKKTGTYKAVSGGDNPMQYKIEVESIKTALLKALTEKKAKPDFLDMDKDGNKKEPMKKAIADKKKGAVKEASKSKPDFLDMDKDGDKKEPMKKAIADKKGAAPKKGQVPPQFKKKTNEAEYKVPNHELSDTARKATSMAQKIKRKINSGEQMDDLDYNQMAELGTTLSRVGASFGPKSMKDVLKHMQDYTNERNQEGNKYPEFTVDRFKELVAMASSTGESSVSEISPDLAKRYTKAAKMDRDFNDDDIARLSKSGQSTRDMQRKNSLRTKGINLAKKRM